MGCLRGLILALCLLPLTGCREKRSLELPARPGGQATAQPPKPIDYYAPDGKLKGSNVRVEWLEIPLAFAATPWDYERHRVFEAKGISLESARDFLAERMLTGTVQESAGDVYYREAMSPAGGEGALRLNVRLSERRVQGGAVRLDIERMSYDGVKPLPFEDAKRALAAEAKHAH